MILWHYDITTIFGIYYTILYETILYYIYYIILFYAILYHIILYYHGLVAIPTPYVFYTLRGVWGSKLVPILFYTLWAVLLYLYAATLRCIILLQGSNCYKAVLYSYKAVLYCYKAVTRLYYTGTRLYYTVTRLSQGCYKIVLCGTRLYYTATGL